MVRSLTIALLACLALTASAGAVTLVHEDGSIVWPDQLWASWGHVPTITGTVTIHPQPCPWSIEPACTTDKYPDEMWIAPWVDDRRTVMHELGHLFDYRQTPGFRDTFMDVLEINTSLWRAAGVPNAPQEKFAEVYALCSEQPGRMPSRGPVGYGVWRLDRQTYRAACGLIRGR